MDIISLPAQQKILSELDDWRYVNLNQCTRRVNRYLKRDDVQQAFHDATLAYWAIKRWDIFRHFRDRIPRQLKPLEGEAYVRPADAESCDWRWFDQKPGRPPLYLDYCLSHACHWMAVPNLLLAKLSFPKCNWITLSSELHTAVVDLDSRLVFDPYFFAVETPISCMFSMLFGDMDKDVMFCEMYSDNQEPYSYLDGCAGPALEFWTLADSFGGTKDELISHLNKFLDLTDQKEDFFEKLELAPTTGPLKAQSENLIELSSRGDQLA